MIAGDREATLLLITGWAVPTAGGWSVLDPTQGDASSWVAASVEDAAALTATLATLPTIAAIHQGRLAQHNGHRASCATLRINPCDCQ